MKRWATKPLGEVLEISRERIEPTEHPDTSFNYVGLESIEGHTGQLLPYQPTVGKEIKSTKNIFHRNEILYGKLRPYLNKVYLAGAEGICSTDIYVLRPRDGKIHSSFAANYLRSPAVLTVVSSAMTGANLPRIGQDALLAISVPLPPLAEQERIANLLDEADELRKLRARADHRTAALIPALFNEMFGADQSQLESVYFAKFLVTIEAKAYFLSCAKRTTNLASINMTQLRALPVPLPAPALQKQFAARVSKIRELEAEQTSNRQRLDDLFQSMLDRTFNGEL
jgi:restriction endonuclease S subunit